MGHDNLYEPRHDKTNKMTTPSEDSDQPGHPPSLIRVFAVRMKNDWVLSYPLSAQRKLWSDWADVQADLSLRWAHSHFVGFVLTWLICTNTVTNLNSRTVYKYMPCMSLEYTVTCTCTVLLAFCKTLIMFQALFVVMFQALFVDRKKKKRKKKKCIA